MNKPNYLKRSILSTSCVVKVAQRNSLSISFVKASISFIIKIDILIKDFCDIAK